MKVVIIICRILCVVVGVWGFVDFGLGTLGEIIVRLFGLSQIWAAAIVSAMVGVFGALSLFRVRQQESQRSAVGESRHDGQER